MEFKSDQRTRGYKTELTPAQERRKQLAPIPIVHNVLEALALFGIQPALPDWRVGQWP